MRWIRRHRERKALLAVARVLVDVDAARAERRVARRAARVTLATR